MTVPKVERAYEKYGWTILFAIGVAGVPISLLLLSGVDPDPTSEESVIGLTLSELKASHPRFFDFVILYNRVVGLSSLGFALLSTAVSVTAYKRGEKWAWYAMWVMPVLFIGDVAIDLSIGGAAAGTISVVLALSIVSLIGLLLPYRKFFPRKT